MIIRMRKISTGHHYDVICSAARVMFALKRLHHFLQRFFDFIRLVESWWRHPIKFDLMVNGRKNRWFWMLDV